MKVFFALIFAVSTVFFVSAFCVKHGLNPLYAIVTVACIAIISMCIFMFIQGEKTSQEWSDTFSHLRWIVKKKIKDDIMQDVNVLTTNLKKDIDENAQERFKSYFASNFFLMLRNNEYIYNRIIKGSINDLYLPKIIFMKLKENEILSIYQLCKLNDEDFRELGFTEGQCGIIKLNLEYSMRFRVGEDNVDNIIFLHDLYSTYHHEPTFREINFPNRYCMLTAKKKLLKKYGSERDLLRLGRVLSTSIWDIPGILSNPARQLYDNEYYCVCDLVESNVQELKKINLVGQGTISKIEKFMLKSGLSWQMEDAKKISELYKSGMFSANDIIQQLIS